MYHWRCMLSLFIYSSVTVFVIVGGQPTIDDNNELHRDDYDQLVNTVSTLVAKVAQLEAEQSTKTSSSKLLTLWTFYNTIIHLLCKLLFTIRLYSMV